MGCRVVGVLKSVWSPRFVARDCLAADKSWSKLFPFSSDGPLSRYTPAVHFTPRTLHMPFQSQQPLAANASAARLVFKNRRKIPVTYIYITPANYTPTFSRALPDFFVLPFFFFFCIGGMGLSHDILLNVAFLLLQTRPVQLRKLCTETL